MKMFSTPTDKPCKRCQKGAGWGLLALLAPFVSGSADIFEISTHDHFRQLSGDPLPYRSCCHGYGIRSHTLRRLETTLVMPPVNPKKSQEISEHFSLGVPMEGARKQ